MADESPLLVLADDGEAPSDQAWHWVAAHRWPDWSVEVVTADADADDIVWGQPPRREEWVPAWSRAEQIEGAGSVRFLKMATDPRAMLAEYAGADLMVLGLRTHSYLEAMVTGSTTEWALHHPPAPLLVATSSDRVETVTVCMDGSAHSRYALSAFLRLPFAAATRVTVLGVDDGRSPAEEGVEAGAAALSGRVADVHVALERGDPTPTILSHLDQHRPQLVVLGTRGLTGWDRIRLGSTASAVVRATHCSSLVACDEEALR